MNAEPCNICGSKDLNLVDGYYYCAECGTQDVNVRETVVEHTILADGTFAVTDKRKFTTVAKEGIEMSGEWYKWHAFNFILCGLADELIKLGAGPGFKMKVLWIWTRYMKKFQVKEETQGDINKTGEISNKDDESEEENLANEVIKKSAKNEEHKKFFKDIKILTKPILIAILWVALNLDRSDIQLANLYKFIREGRISFLDSAKFVPKEINTNKIEHWKTFKAPSTNRMKCFVLRLYAMTLFKRLDLGSPHVPDVRKMVINYLRELCLPDGLKHLVFALMNLVPCDFLTMKPKNNNMRVVRTPDFEGTVMAYIIIALKLCFGLDDDYEVKLSDTIEKINRKDNHMKSYKIGNSSIQTDRLFSFREWCNYYQFRKSILSKHYFPIAQMYNVDTDEYVLLEQRKDKKAKRKIELRDEITMDILNKIPQVAEAAVIPQSEFEPTLTPLSTYTEIISEYIQDPDLRLLLCEDFTKYSMNYIFEDLKLIDPDSDENVIVGIDEKNKTISNSIVGLLTSTDKTDKTMIYVRNCENKNWLKTKPPTVDHISIVDENSDDINKDSDQRHDINVANNTEFKYSSQDTDEEEENFRELEVIEEEIIGYSIFDDNFDDIEEDEKKGNQDDNRLVFEASITNNNHDNHIDNINSDIMDSKSGSISDTAATIILPEFNADTFNREATIKELVMLACKKYKIPIPRQYKDYQPKKTSEKRKSTFIDDQTGQTEKRQKVNKYGGIKDDVEKIVSAYISILQNDVLNTVSEQVRKVIQDNENQYQHVSELVPNNTSNVGNACNEENAEQLENAGEDNQSDIVNISNNSQKSDDEQDENALFPKDDPRFDEKLYNIKQLYVKFKQNMNIDELFDSDPEIDEIITKKIEEIETGKGKPIEVVEINCESNSKNIDEEFDSEEDIPLAVLKKQKLLKKQKKERRFLPPLIEKTDHIKEFKYWLRHYSTHRWHQSSNIGETFELELMSNYSKSFTFVIRECASIIECSPYTIYKQLQYLEPLLMKMNADTK